MYEWRLPLIRSSRRTEFQYRTTECTLYTNCFLIYVYFYVCRQVVGLFSGDNRSGVFPAGEINYTQSVSEIFLMFHANLGVNV